MGHGGVKINAVSRRKLIGRIFNEELHFSGNDAEQNLEVKMIPAIQANATTKWVDESEQQRIFDFMESISINVEIDDTGIVTENVTVE